ncbi:MAG: CBS domain-containing protein [Dehalococcoidia bacterium]|nr:CBS domain-containing protein [Dehalococcoidia bacterium]MSQ34426.1 CBS domain-containing protein [Dehalococcoidia bacterium]
MAKETAGHTVKDIMTSPVLTIGRDKSVADAVKILLEHQIGGLPVVGADGKYLGMVTERTLLPHEEGLPFKRGTLLVFLGQFVKGDQEIEKVLREARDRKVADVMARHVPTATEETPVSDVAARMIHQNVHHIPVLRAGNVVGIVSRHDLLRVMAGLPE